MARTSFIVLLMLLLTSCQKVKKVDNSQSQQSILPEATEIVLTAETPKESGSCVQIIAFPMDPSGKKAKAPVPVNVLFSDAKKMPIPIYDSPRCSVGDVPHGLLSFGAGEQGRMVYALVRTVGQITVTATKLDGTSFPVRFEKPLEIIENKNVKLSLVFSTLPERIDDLAPPKIVVEMREQGTGFFWQITTQKLSYITQR